MIAPSFLTALVTLTLSGPVFSQGRVGRQQEDPTQLLSGFEEAEVRERRTRARTLFQSARIEDIRACAVLAADPDVQVREALVDLYGRPDFASEQSTWRTSTLAELARSDPASAVRNKALDTLATLDNAESAQSLAGLTRTLAPPDRARAARGLANSRLAVEKVATLVRAAFGSAPPSERTPPDVLAELLGAFAQGFVTRDERPLARELQPLVAALSYPDPSVARAAGVALGQMLAGLAEKGDGPRALDTMEALRAAGLDPLLVDYNRARLALYPAGDPQAALLAARALAAGAGAVPEGRNPSLSRGAARLEQLHEGMTRRGREWLVRARYLEGLAQIALGEVDAAQARLQEALSLANALRGDRWDRNGVEMQGLYADDLFHCALAEVALVLVQLERGISPASPEVLGGLWRAYRNQLGTQLLRAGLSSGAAAGMAQGSWDSLLDSELSPYRLLFARLNLPGLSIEHALELQEQLGRALATLSPDEQPGFEPLKGLSPESAAITRDPFPQAWLKAILTRQLDRIEDEQYRIQGTMARAGGTGWEVQEPDLQRLELLTRHRQELLGQQALLDSDPSALRRDLRLPATQSLWLARDLREEGYAARGRVLAVRARDDLERVGISNTWYFVGIERLVRADLVIGSCYTDEDEPLLAEQTLLGAVERLQGVLSRLNARGVSPAAQTPFEVLQSNALVSLAVNANVRLGQPERALEFYERAYSLRQDDFMDVLLACYRARSGRASEARRVLRRVRPGPRTWYNMACTYALMGESSSALQMLERELTENHSSEASRDRQRRWAAQDPDLASLREDPRFRELTRSSQR